MKKTKHKKLVIGIIVVILISVVVIEANIHAYLPYDLSAISRGVSRNIKATISGTEEEHIVYITKSGDKYHSPFCRYLRYSSIEMSIQEAEASGYEPCSKCAP